MGSLTGTSWQVCEALGAAVPHSDDMGVRQAARAGAFEGSDLGRDNMVSLSGAETTCERPGGAGYLPGRGSAGRRIWARGLGALPRPCESQPPIQRRRRAPAPHKYRGGPRQCRVQRAGMLPLPFLPGPHTPGSCLLRLCRTRRKRRPGPEAHILAPCSWFPHRRLRSKLQKHVRVPCRASVKPRSNARGDPCQDKRAWQPQR